MQGGAKEKRAISGSGYIKSVNQSLRRLRDKARLALFNPYSSGAVRFPKRVISSFDVAKVISTSQE